MRRWIGFVLAGWLAVLLAAPVCRSQAPVLPKEPVSLLQVATGLTSPVTLVAAPDGSGRLFIVDQIGLIRILQPNGILLSQPFLDLRNKLVPLMPGYDERGLLGLAFHPNYAVNGRFYVFYNIPLRAGGPAGWDSTLRLSEFKVSNSPNLADANSERVLLEVDKPEFNHNGGTLAFGPDRDLYISIGDGGNKNDIGLGHTPGLGNAQDLTKLLGKVLRIDVDHGTPYGIPADNPLVGTNARGEIFAYGFRNPYRFSFDLGGNHDLILGDAGQSLWEELDLVVKGGDYGWHIKEGTHCFNPDNEFAPPLTCPDTGPRGEPLIDPVIEYPNASNPIGGLGVTNIAGYFYRGRQMPRLQNRLIFGDFSRSFVPGDGTLLVATPQAAGLWAIHELRVTSSANGRVNHYIKGFGQDAAGEVYVLTTDALGPSGVTGKVYKLVFVSRLQVNATLTRNGDILANVTVTNTGDLDVTGVQITAARLGTTSTTSPAQSLGALPVGGAASVTLRFPASAGTAGTASVLRITGASSAGSFAASLRVQIP